MNAAAARQVMRAVFAFGAFGVSGALGGCSFGSGGDELAGSVTVVAEESDDVGRWVVTIDLDSGSVGGSDVVRVAFDEIDLVCDDGSGVVVPSSLSVGDRLTVARGDADPVETSDPPIVEGERVVVLCSQ